MQTLVKRGPDYTGEVRRLLDAGRAVMRRCGTGSRPRVADIVAEAGLSNDAFYRHFASKDALVAAILDDGTERLVSYLAHQMTKEETRRGQGPPVGRGRPRPGLRRGRVPHTTLAVLWNAGDLGSTVLPHTLDRARLATLLPEPLGELGCPDPEVDAVLVAHAVVGTLTDLLWQHRRPSRTGRRPPGRVLSWPPAPRTRVPAGRGLTAPATGDPPSPRRGG